MTVRPLRAIIGGVNRPFGLHQGLVTHATKHRLLEAGLELMLERGYNDTGIQDLIDRTGVPKGSFYHHFASKEGFAHQVIDLYMVRVHACLDEALGDPDLPALGRVRRFFELTREVYASQGYLGCMLGALGQELSGVSPTFRTKIEGCFTTVAKRLAGALEEARRRGELPADADPERMANVLVDSWEGAALRTRIVRSAAPLEAVIAFYFEALSPG